VPSLRLVDGDGVGRFDKVSHDDAFPMPGDGSGNPVADLLPHHYTPDSR
jgi:hypothetical protein